MSNLTMFWQRFLRLKTHDTILSASKWLCIYGKTLYTEFSENVALFWHVLCVETVMKM